MGSGGAIGVSDPDSPLERGTFAADGRDSGVELASSVAALRLGPRMLPVFGVTLAGVADPWEDKVTIAAIES